MVSVGSVVWAVVPRMSGQFRTSWLAVEARVIAWGIEQAAIRLDDGSVDFAMVNDLFTEREQAFNEATARKDLDRKARS